MISQPHTPDIDDIIIAYHTYVTEDGTYSQEFEVSRDEVVRALAAAEQRGAERAFRKTQEIIAGFDHTIDEARNRDDMINSGYLIQELDAEIQDLQGDSQ